MAVIDTLVKTELDLIGAIYDAVIDPSRWDDSVDRIRRHLGFQICMMTATLLPSGRVLIGAQSNVPHPFSETVHQYGKEALDQWGGMERIGTLVREEPLVHSDYNSVGDWVGNPFYENWAKPQGLVDQLALVLEYNSRLLANISFGRHESMPPISAEQVEKLRLLAPHLRRAAIISGLLDGRAQAAASFAAVLDQLNSAVLIVDDDMQIIHANEAGEAMLHAGDPLLRFNGRLELRRELVSGQFEAAVHAAIDDARGLLRGGGIPARRNDGSAVMAHVLPLKRRIAPTGNAMAAVFVTEPNAPLNLPLEGIQALYGLRPAEGRVLELIVAGMSAPQIAKALGIALSTVKTHTVRLFDKLGVHSRAEVQRLARDMSVDARRL